MDPQPSDGGGGGGSSIIDQIHGDEGNPPAPAPVAAVEPTPAPQPAQPSPEEPPVTPGVGADEPQPGDDAGGGDGLILGKYKTQDDLINALKSSGAEAQKLAGQLKQSDQRATTAEQNLEYLRRRGTGPQGAQPPQPPIAQPTGDVRGAIVRTMAQRGKFDEVEAARLYDSIEPLLNAQTAQARAMSNDARQEANYALLKSTPDWQEHVANGNIQRQLEEHSFLNDNPDAPQMLLTLAKGGTFDQAVKDATEVGRQAGIKEALAQKKASESVALPAGQGQPAPTQAGVKPMTLKDQILLEFGGKGAGGGEKTQPQGTMVDELYQQGQGK